MKSIIALLRIHQWVKNLFLFVPAFFAGHLELISEIIVLSKGWLAFSLVASSIYIINDANDVKQDRLHPVKSKRPIASGSISLKQAYAISFVALAFGLLLAAFLHTHFFALLIGYFFLNIAYSFKLKHIPILDIHCIALGFMIRIFSGGILVNVEISHWLGVMTYLLSLFIALAKRRDDLVLQEENGHKLRKSLDGYNMLFVNQAMGMMAAILVVAYIQYTTTTEIILRYKTSFLYLSVIPVVIGIFRYMQITFVEKRSGSPTKILYSDLFLQLTILVWVIYFVVVIYLK
jgi:4-hydroxybenzoate polyprenyltransferase